MCAILEDLNDNPMCIKTIKEMNFSRYKVAEPI
jgi:hypothetical protein